MKVKRGEIYGADFSGINCRGSEQMKNERPVVIISNDKANMNDKCDIVMVCLMSTNVEKMNVTHCQLKERDYKMNHLDKPCKVMTEHIRTISKQRLSYYKGKLSPETMEEVNNKIQLATGIFDFL